MKAFLLSFFLLLSATGYAQFYTPSVLILDPHSREYDSSLTKEIAEFSFQANITDENEKEFTESIKNRSLNIQKMDIEEMRFRKDMDFASAFTLSLTGMVTYIIFGQTENGLIFPSHETCNGEITDLKALADKNNVQWIINPLLIKTYVEGKKKFTAVRLQVYDNKKRQIVLDKEYVGDTKNPGLQLTCSEGTLYCTVSNVLNVSLNDVMSPILKKYQR